MDLNSIKVRTASFHFPVFSFLTSFTRGFDVRQSHIRPVQMCFDSGGLQMSERVTGRVHCLRRNPSRGAGTSSICLLRAMTD